MDNLHPVIFYTGVAAIGFMVGMAKGGLGGLIGSLATPLMTLLVGPQDALGLALPLLMTADPFAVAFHWRKWDRRLILLLLPGAVVGLTIGTYLITQAPTRTLQIIIGVIVMIFVAYKLVENRVLAAINYEAKDWHSLIAGTVAGFSSSLAHIGGPPISIYLLMRRVSSEVFLGTMVLFFFILNWIKVPYYIAADLFDWALMLKIVVVLPAVPLGVWFGRWLTSKVDQKTFEKIIVAALALAGLIILIEAFAG
jgi:hypothetical protein